MSKIRLVQGDDWGGIYIDGKLVDEGHSLNAWSLVHELQKLGIDITYNFYDFTEDEWAQHGFRMPTNYSDLSEYTNE